MRQRVLRCRPDHVANVELERTFSLGRRGDRHGAANRAEIRPLAVVEANYAVLPRSEPRMLARRLIELDEKRRKCVGQIGSPDNRRVVLQRGTHTRRRYHGVRDQRSIVDHAPSRPAAIRGRRLDMTSATGAGPRKSARHARRCRGEVLAAAIRTNMTASPDLPAIA